MTFPFSLPLDFSNIINGDFDLAGLADPTPPQLPEFPETPNPDAPTLDPSLDDDAIIDDVLAGLDLDAIRSNITSLLGYGAQSLPEFPETLTEDSPTLIDPTNSPIADGPSQDLPADSPPVVNIPVTGVGGDTGLPADAQVTGASGQSDADIINDVIFSDTTPTNVGSDFGAGGVDGIVAGAENLLPPVDQVWEGGASLIQGSNATIFNAWQNQLANGQTTWGELTPEVQAFMQANGYQPPANQVDDTDDGIIDSVLDDPGDGAPQGDTSGDTGTATDAAGGLPLAKDLVLKSIADGTTDLGNYSQQQLDTLGISTEDLNRAQLDEEDVKGQVTGAIQEALGEAGEAAVEIAGKFFDWLLTVLDPTNIPGIGIKVNGSTGNIEFGVLNIPGLVFGTLNPGTGVFSTGGGSISLPGGQSGGGTGTPGGGGQTDDDDSTDTPDNNTETGVPPDDTDDGVIDDIIDDDDTTDQNTDTTGGSTNDDTTGTDDPGTGIPPDDDQTDDDTGTPPTNSGDDDDDDETFTFPDPTTGDGIVGSISDFWDAWGDKILGSASAAASAAITIDGLDTAAEKQLEGVLAGIDFQKQTFEEIRNDLAPFIGAGQSTADAAANAALEEFTFEGADLSDDVPVNSATGDLPDIPGSDNIGSGPTPSTGLDTSGLSAVGAIDAEAGGLEGGNVEVNKFDPFDPNDPVLRFLQDESRRMVESSAAADGFLQSGGTLTEISDRAQNVALGHASAVQDIMTQRDSLNLAADKQGFEQNATAIQYNFVSSLQLQDAQQQKRANEFAELVTSDQLTFDQELQFRQQLNAEEQQIFDQVVQGRAQLMAEREQIFRQDQVQFEDRFNMNAQDFMQQFNMSKQQFHELIENTKVGANAAAGLATNATANAVAQSELLAATGLAQGGVSAAKSQQYATLFTELINIFKP